MRVDGVPIVRSYLRFNITGINGTVTQAKLRVYTNSSSSSGISVWAVNNTTWGETSITYSNAPVPGSIVATSSAVTAGSWKELDVTGLINMNGLKSMGLSTSGGTAISLASREAGGNAPQLVITVQSTGNGTPTPTRTPTGTPTRTPTGTPTASSTPDTVVILAAGDIAKCTNGIPVSTAAQITSDMLLNTSGISIYLR